jgi:hypothetical protein
MAKIKLENTLHKNLTKVTTAESDKYITFKILILTEQTQVWWHQSSFG